MDAVKHPLPAGRCTKWSVRFGIVAFFLNICRSQASSFVARTHQPLSHPPLPGDAMKKEIIFNLPVKDLDKSKAFFSALGFEA
jgi:hypothetical protein